MLSQLFQAEQQGRMGKEILKRLAADKKGDHKKTI